MTIENALLCGAGLIILYVILNRLPGQRPPDEPKRATARKPRRKRAKAVNVVAPPSVELEATPSSSVVQATPAAADPSPPREREKIQEGMQELANQEGTSLPSLDDCVAYRKEGLKAVSPSERRRPPLRAAEKARPAVDRTDDEEEEVFEVVQTESEWKRAAPKPRKPPRTETEEKKAKKKTPTASDASEKNRKKREKQKQKELAVREIMRKQL